MNSWKLHCQDVGTFTLPNSTKEKLDIPSLLPKGSCFECKLAFMSFVFICHITWDVGKFMTYMIFCQVGWGMLRWSARSPLSFGRNDGTYRAGCDLVIGGGSLVIGGSVCLRRVGRRSTPHCSTALSTWAIHLVWSLLPWRTDATEHWWASQLHLMFFCPYISKLISDIESFVFSISRIILYIFTVCLRYRIFII